MTIDSSPALVVPVATGMKRKLPETKKETAALSSHYSTVIVDIEGTTTPISFVKDVLFPFIPENIHDFLTRNWDSSDSQAAVKALQAQSELDNKKEANKEEDDEIKVEVAPRIPQIDINSKETLISAICANVAWQMARDRKITALKAFQGLMWAEAYKRGDVKGAVFEDVVPALEKWSLSSNKKSIYVYSSGSVDAQILLFKYSEKGDLTRVSSNKLRSVLKCWISKLTSSFLIVL